jgi:predicted lipoprotein with Yx(FWY)xxD motif
LRADGYQHFGLAPMPRRDATAIVSQARQANEKEDTMPTNKRLNAGAAALPPWLIATAAAFATLAALVFFVQPSAGGAAQTRGPVVSTATTTLGRILVDSRGHTLYLFEKDRSGKSACAGHCAMFWPPLIAAAKPRAAGGARASLLGTTRRADGRMQVTYRRHPLYTFVKDTRKGHTRGEEVDAFGAEWYAISAAGVRIEKDDG